MKSFFIVMLVFLLVIFTSCTPGNDPSPSNQSSQTTTPTSTLVTESQPTTSTQSKASEKAEILNGKVILGMTTDDMSTALAAEGILVNDKVDGFSMDGLTLQPQEDGSLYWVEKDLYCYYTNNGIELQFRDNSLIAIEISAASNLPLESGLKTNDSLSKMVAIYGECEIVIEKILDEPDAAGKTYRVYYQYAIENGYLQIYPIESVDGYVIYTIRLSSERGISLPDTDGIMEKERINLGIKN